MRPHLACHILFGLFFISQVNHVGSKRLQEEELLELQLKAENLVEKIIDFIQDFKKDRKTELKCIPDYVSEALMEILKNAITCFEENEKNYNSGKIGGKTRANNFLQCLTNGRKEIRGMVESIDTTIDYCPDIFTEKTYQINVTTTFSKTFLINIKNGLEITKKKIELNKHTFGGEQDTMEESEEDESEMETDKKYTDGITRQYEVRETEQGKSLEKPKIGKNNSKSNSTEGGNGSDCNDDGNAERSTKKTDQNYDHDTELSSGSSEDSDESTDETVHHFHRQFFQGRMSSDID